MKILILKTSTFLALTALTLFAISGAGAIGQIVPISQTNQPETLSTAGIQAAAQVVAREFGTAALRNVTFSAIPNVANRANRDVFEYAAANGHLTVRGTSPVALCSGYYQYIKQAHLGISSWSGNRFDLAKPWPDAPQTRVESPYRYRYYLNVVTFGYTAPYWTWNRWQKEIDWMALHGINMPLSPVATEAIATRVWKKLGLTQKEIGDFYTGPAHLPWQRMGNLTRLEGPLTANWNRSQIALEHKILNSERALGMHPIAQAFAGFVPEGLKRLYPKLKLRSMAWSSFAKKYHSHILSPESPLFAKIGTLTIKEWEKEFGKNQFFLSDSFNEMKIPANGEAAKNALLAHYGDVIYRSIKNADPNITWVMQGWMFGYMRGQWTKKAVRALLSKVPDDKMLILDEAMDYNAHFWHNEMSYKFYNGFFGKEWIGGYIPNMGGKTAFTGFLDFYARGGADALATPNHGNMVGLGIVPEGIENNEVIYELISDTFWTAKPIDVNTWLKNYCLDRYGSANSDLLKAWQLLHESCYNSFVPHPHFSWQLEPGSTRCSVDQDPKITEAAQLFLANGEQLKTNPLYRADAIEFTMMAAGIRANQLIQKAMKLYKKHDLANGKKTAAKAFELLSNLDRLLVSHPNLRLSNWVNLARANGDTPQEKNHYEEDAKLLITLWGKNGEINDYSCRIWAGLISGYYIPRWKMYFENLGGAHHDIIAWEKKWVSTPGVVEQKPFADPVAAAKRILAKIKTTP